MANKKSKKKKSRKEEKDLPEYKHKKKHKSKTLEKELKKSKKHKKEKKAKSDEEKTEIMDVPLMLMEKSKQDMKPMTKEEWEKQQNVVRRVYDETTGRNRLIKGDGEVIEEIVSRERHKEINKKATQGDQEYFQSTLISNLKKEK